MQFDKKCFFTCKFHPNVLEYIYKGINATHSGHRPRLTDILSDGLFVDKEITVRICSNGHYRISREGQVGMLIALRVIEGLLGKFGGTRYTTTGYGRVSPILARSSYEECFLFSSFTILKGK